MSVIDKVKARVAAPQRETGQAETSDCAGKEGMVDTGRKLCSGRASESDDGGRERRTRRKKKRMKG